MKRKSAIFFIVIVLLIIILIFFLLPREKIKVDENTFNQETGIRLVINNSVNFEKSEIIKELYICYKNHLSEKLRKPINQVNVEPRGESDKRIGGSSDGNIFIYLYNETKDICLTFIHESVHLYLLTNNLENEWKEISKEGFNGREYFLDSVDLNKAIISYNSTNGKSYYFDGGEKRADFGLIDPYSGLSYDEDIATFVSAIKLKKEVNWNKEYDSIYKNKIELLKREGLV